MEESPPSSSSPEVNPPGVLIIASDSDSTPQAGVEPVQEVDGTAEDDNEESRTIRGYLEEWLFEQIEVGPLIPNRVRNPEDMLRRIQALREMERRLGHQAQLRFQDIFINHVTSTDHPDWSLLRNLRLLCRSWNSSVNGSLVSHPSHVSSPKVTNYSKSHVERLESFVQSFISFQTNDPSYNPLPRRHLVISVWMSVPKLDNEDLAEITIKFSDAVCQYLRAFGHYLIHLVVEIQGEFCKENLYLIYKFICEWLSLIPKLCSLTMDYFNLKLNVDDNFRSQVDHLTFPSLAQLSILKFTYFNNFALNLLKKNERIRKLLIENSASLRLEILDCVSETMTLRFPNLLECSIEVADDGVVGKDTPGIWELKKLTLVIWCLNPQSPNLYRVISTVTKPSKLEHLTLNFVYSDANLKGEVDVLDLPCLKHLFIKLAKYELIDWYEFLIGVPRLETISVEIRNFDDAFAAILESDEANQAFLNKMEVPMEANFWYFLPKLKGISFTIYQDRFQFETRQRILRHDDMPDIKLNVLFKRHN